MSGSKFVYVAYIRITPEKLWNALTTSEIIKQYRFGMSVESEWKVGSTWRMYADGSLMDSGEILESVSQKRLVMSWLNEWKPEFKAEGVSRCVYEIEPTGTSAKLTLTHSIERTDSKFIGAVSEGWPMVISNLKSLLETGILLSFTIADTEINHGKVVQVSSKFFQPAESALIVT
jgi:uncharacterized protein YndB with AHSA1/START domain